MSGRHGAREALYTWVATPHKSQTTVDEMQALVVLIIPGLVTALVRNLPGLVNRYGSLSSLRLEQVCRHQALKTLCDSSLTGRDTPALPVSFDRSYLPLP